ncbi:uncharacterized protein LOC122854889 isoform X3 [Aphidius gifuensis]|uniref:uncharacterized protein LOC122854889 isoform X3 n=1 Tax=Aphidius gifuensis TaxID=684658 RepID=UPI001CDB7ECB|nr:uncharacterized protein LOC122854889 isoform X3 [Aphidius gifuensis]
MFDLVKLSRGARLFSLIVLQWLLLGLPVRGVPDPPELTTLEDMTGRGSKKFSDQCSEDRECGFRGSYCDPRTKKCFCREEFEVTNYLDKCGHPANVNETCFFTQQCEYRVPQTECRDRRCICRFEKIPLTRSDGYVECVAEQQADENLRYVNPAMISILVAMALMFIIICVVLRLFSKARYGENRSIFNTPNARLMNVSLLRDNNKLLHAQERRGSKVSQRAPSRQPSMGSLRAHSPNGSHPGSSRIGSRRGSRGSGNGNPTSSSAPSTTIKTLKPSSNQNDPVIEDVTIEISDRDIQSF